MKRILYGLFMLLMLAALSQAQSPTPYDCQFSATFTSTSATTASYYNKGPSAPCIAWRLTYNTVNATGVSISLQGTTNLPNGNPDPAGWTNLSVTAPVTNPATGTAAGTIAACCDYYPWLRVTAGTFTGTGQTMSLTVLGYKGTSAARTTGGGASLCTLSGTQTTGFVLTATDNASACAWQTPAATTVNISSILAANYCPDTGAANAITCSTATTFGAYAAGQTLVVKMAATNTGATTIVVNSIAGGGKAVTKAGAIALAAGNLVAGQEYALVYDGTRFQALNSTLLAADLPVLFTALSGDAASTPTGGATTVTGLTSPSLHAAPSPITETWTVGAGGVTQYHLVATDASAPAKVVAATAGGYGVAQSTVPAGTVEVARSDTTLCTTDAGGSTAQHLAIWGIGATCADSGFTASSSISIQTRIIGEFITTAAGGANAIVSLFPSHFGTAFQASTTAGSLVFQGGQDAAVNSTLGNATISGGNQTGPGGASSIAGSTLIKGGTNAGTNAASVAGTLQIEGGESTAGGLPGLFVVSNNFFQSGTMHQWRLVCPTSVSMTVQECAASPQLITGVALHLNSTVSADVAVQESEVPIDASAAVTVGHTVCAGTTAGKITDSGGTAPCTVGRTMGIVIAVSGVWPTYPDGAPFPTLSTTLPLVKIGRLMTATTINGSNCIPGGTCNVNASNTAHTVALNEGVGSNLGQSSTVGNTGQVLIGNTGADPSWGAVPIPTATIAQKFFGTAAPGSVAGNLPGDFYTDTTAHYQYVCGAPSGTAAPACTTVSAGGWQTIPYSLKGSETSDVGLGKGANAALTGTGYNTSVGYNASNATTTGLYDVAVGYAASQNLRKGSYNTSVGGYALDNSYDNDGNTAIGYQSLYNTFSGAQNTGVGNASLYTNNAGASNAALGSNALYSNNGGSYNVAIGAEAGYTATPANANVSGNSNTWIGRQSGPGSVTQLSNSFALGATAVVTASNQGVIGNGSLTNVYFGSEAAAATIHPAQGITLDIATPAAPTTNYTKWYTKAGKLCSLDPGASENCTGAGGIAPPVTFTDIVTPAIPGAGDTAWYTKGGKLCSLSPASVEACTGGGGGPTTQTATSNLANGTVYHNTGTTPTHVSYSWRCTTGSGDAYAMTGSTNTLANPTNVVSISESAGTLFWTQVSFIVLPSWYYSITQEGCTLNGAAFWTEWN